MMAKRKRLVVVGNGMVGHKLIDLLIGRGAHHDWQIATFCEEPRPAYDRVNLSAFFKGKSADDLSLVAPTQYQDAGIELHLSDKAVSIDRTNKLIKSARGREVSYDKLVLATGSYPFVPPIAGRDAKGHLIVDPLDVPPQMVAHRRHPAVAAAENVGQLPGVPFAARGTEAPRGVQPGEPRQDQLGAWVKTVRPVEVVHAAAGVDVTARRGLEDELP